MNNQEMFDTVVNHLRKQGEKSITSGRLDCWYRFNGLMCAAGVLIKDEFYDESFEGNTVFSHLVQKALRNSIGAYDDELLAELQSIHDNYDVEEWEDKFKDSSKVYGLKYTPPEVT